jgi:hypothetical protein
MCHCHGHKTVKYDMIVVTGVLMEGVEGFDFNKDKSLFGNAD